MFSLLASPFFCLVLAALSPTMFFAMLNLRFFNWRQVGGAMVLALCIGGMAGAVAQGIGTWVDATALGVAFAGVGASAGSLLGCAGALAILLVFAQRILSENLPQPRRRALVLGGVAAILLAASAFLSLAVFNILLLLFVASAVLDGCKQAKKPKTLLFSSHNDNYLRPAERTEHNVQLAHKPNIYVLFLESYHSEKALREGYGIDDARTTELFRENGFTLYDDVLCNEPSTVSSLMNLFNCSLLGSAQGGMFALDVLRDNGYACEFFDSSFFAFGGLPQKGEYTSFKMPGYVYFLYSLAGPLFAQSRFIRKVVQNIDPFNTDIDFPYILSCLRRRMAAAAKAPRFFCMRFGALHASKFYPAWDADGSGFAAVYRKAVKKAQTQIAQTVTAIKKADPDALVIAVGDHGSLRHTYAWHGQQGPDAALASRGVGMEELVRDHFAVRLAVHWPLAHKTHGVTLSHVNIFKYVFEALGGGSNLLDELAPNVCIVDRRLIAAREGRALAKFEPFRAEEIYADVWERVRNGSASLSDYFQLSGAMQGQNPGRMVELLREADKKFADNAHISGALGDALCTLGNIEGLEYLAKAVRLLPEHTTFAANYIKFLSLFGRHGEVMQQFTDEILKTSAESTLYGFRSLLALGRKEEAEAWARRILALHPGDYRPALFFLVFLLEEKRFADALAVAEKALSYLAQIEDVFLNRIRIAKGLALLGAGSYKEAEDHFAWMMSLPGTGAWSCLLWAQLLEKDGRVLEAIKGLLEVASNNVTYSACLLAEAGRMTLRGKLQDKYLLPAKLAALEEQRRSAGIVAKSSIFDEAWYRKSWQRDADPTPPLLHYLYNGVLQGISPLPWFSTWSYMLLCPELWHVGASPLVYFLECEILQEFSIVRHPWSIVGKNPELIKDRLELLRAVNEAWAA